MNFLTHSYLAGPSEDKIFGTLLGGNIKVNTYHKYNEETLEGIHQFKKINNFTLNHPSFFKSKERLNPKYRKHASLLITIFYDHFLAAGWRNYSPISLESHSEKIYQILRNKAEVLPYKIKMIYPVMSGSNWLTNFSTLKGTHAAIKEMVQICTFQSNLEYAFMDLMEKYPLYKDDFNSFFPDLIENVKKSDYYKNKETYELVAAS